MGDGEINSDTLLAHLRSFDPYELEKLVGELWRRFGYEVDVKPGSQDKGIDIEAVKNDPFRTVQLIQVKRFSENSKISSKMIWDYRVLYDQESNVDVVGIVTTGGFTGQALEIAEDLNVRTMAGPELSLLLLDKMGEDYLRDFLDLVAEEDQEDDTEESFEEDIEDGEEEPDYGSFENVDESNTREPSDVERFYDEYSEEIEKAEREFDRY